MAGTCEPKGKIESLSGDSDFRGLHRLGKMKISLEERIGEPFTEANSRLYKNVILDSLVNYRMLWAVTEKVMYMSISPIFMFAPVPLTSERSPLAHAADLARRRLAESQGTATPRHRTKPAPVSLKIVEKPVVEPAVA
jgi:hypothetical protein